LLVRFLKAGVGLLAGATLLTLAAPLVGEAIATRPPMYPRGTEKPLDDWGLDYVDATFPTSDGLTLRGWFVPALRPDAPAILYAPATAKDQRSGLSLVPAFHQAGYHVLLFSYRGHARSDGKRGNFTYGEFESRDVDAAVRFLRQEKGVERIAVIGHSAGAVSAILSGARNPDVDAIVAVAPFGSLDEVWHTSRPTLVPRFILNWTLWVSERARGFSRDTVRAINVVDRIAPRPLLVIHGTGDERITEDQVRRLFSVAEEPKTLWLVNGVGHAEIRDPVLDQLAPDVIAFLDSALARPQAPVDPLARIPRSSAVSH
jgi:alpha-beta hydrolase superfamily lysophospholipase